MIKGRGRAQLGHTLTGIEACAIGGPIKVNDIPIGPGGQHRHPHVPEENNLNLPMINPTINKGK